MIFNGIPHNDGIETINSALQAIFKRKESLSLPIPWSYVELQPDEADSDWLRNWARCLKAYTIREAERRDKTPGDTGIPAGGLLYNWQVGLGVLLLFAGADGGRRDAPAGGIWPILYDALRGQGTQALLFPNKNASPLLYALIHNTVIVLDMRHDFDCECGQSWYNTFWLQFGFSHRAFYGDLAAQGADTELPNWLARQDHSGATIAIDLLLNDKKLHSPSFYQLWRAMAEFRRGERDELSLCNILQNNVWVLPQWSDDLIVCLKKKRDLMAQLPQLSFDFTVPEAAPLHAPRLQWDADTPQFEFPLSSQCALSSQHEMLNLVLSPKDASEHKKTVVLTHQPNGYYAPTLVGTLTVPAWCREATAEVIAPDGASLWGDTYVLWDGAEDINVFALTTGERLEDVENDEMKMSAGYILFVADDLVVSDTKLKWKALPNSYANAYLLPPGWSETLEVRSCDADAFIWKPKIASRPVCPLPATVCPDNKEQHFGEEVRFCVNCQEGMTLEAAFCGSKALERIPLSYGTYLLKGAFLSADTPRPHMALKLTFHRNGVPEKHEVSVRLNPAGMLMRKGAQVWNFGKDSELDAYIARHDQFRVFVPQRETGEFKSGWTLWEGETPHGSVARGWRPLPAFDGLGAPFTARTGEWSEECLPLSASVVDHGMMKSYSIRADDDDKRWLTIFLHQPIPITEGLEIRWWDKWWKMQNWKPGNPPNGKEWRIPLQPACHGDPLALAIALNGRRLGALWNKKWYTESALFQLGSEKETARNLRWLRLPVLFPAASERIQQFISCARPVLPSAWLEDEGTVEWSFEPGLPTESWKRAARILLNIEEE